MNSGDDLSGFPQFCAVHARQLQSIGLPESLWRRAHALVASQTFDAGEHIAFAHLEADDGSAGDALVAVAARALAPARRRLPRRPRARVRDGRRLARGARRDAPALRVALRQRARRLGGRRARGRRRRARGARRRGACRRTVPRRRRRGRGRGSRAALLRSGRGGVIIARAGRRRRRRRRRNFALAPFVDDTACPPPLFISLAWPTAAIEEGELARAAADGRRALAPRRRRGARTRRRRRSPMCSASARAPAASSPPPPSLPPPPPTAAATAGAPPPASPALESLAHDAADAAASTVKRAGVAAVRGALDLDWLARRAAPAVEAAWSQLRATLDASDDFAVSGRRANKRSVLRYDFALGDALPAADVARACARLHPALDTLLGGRGAWKLSYVGAVVAVPGAPDQNLHRDGPHLFAARERRVAAALRTPVRAAHRAGRRAQRRDRLPAGHATTQQSRGRVRARRGERSARRRYRARARAAAALARRHARHRRG